jgi:hypothetical protein
LPSPLCSVAMSHTSRSRQSARCPVLKRFLDSTDSSCASSCGDTVLLKFEPDHSLRIAWHEISRRSGGEGEEWVGEE